MQAMFNIETPSRVMRRIEQLEEDDDELPTLPDFPSFGHDSDASYRSASPPKALARPAPRSPLGGVALNDRTNNNKQSGNMFPHHLSAKPKPVAEKNPSPPPLPSVAAPVLASDAEDSELEQDAETETEDEALASLPPIESLDEQSISEDKSHQEEHESVSAESNTSLPSRRFERERTPFTPSALSDPGFATPQAGPSSTSRADLERRKEHLLQTLRKTAQKPKPRPGSASARRQRASSISSDGDGEHPSHHLDSPSYDESDGASSTNDLLGQGGRANTSLPTGGAVEGEKSTRFNGAKLNSYLHTLNTHLTEENQSLARDLGATNQEVARLKKEAGRLEDQVREMSRSVLQSGNESSSREEEWEEKLDEVRRERDDQRRALEEMQAQIEAANGEARSSVERADALLIELEEKDVEIEAAKKETMDQEQEFADKMGRLEEELCRVMEEQEKGMAHAQEGFESARQEEREDREVERRRYVELEQEVVALRQEKDQIQRQLASSSIKPSSDSGQTLASLKLEVGRLQDLVDARDEELAKLNAEMDDFETQIDKLDISDAESRRLLAEQAESLRQSEEALEESSKMLERNEEELAELRSTLDRERKVNSALGAQIRELSAYKSKAKSPLANEVSVDDTMTTTTGHTGHQAAMASLEADLASAKSEIVELRKRLQERDVDEAREEERLEIEERVANLRREMVAISLTPRKAFGGGTPDSSVMFKSIIGLATPKTPGQFLANMSNWSPGSAASDTTISPLLAQIQELEQIVHHLRQQLTSANADIDAKLSQLDPAALLAAQERIARLEEEKRRLVDERADILRGVEGLKGDLERVKREADGVGRDLVAAKEDREAQRFKSELEDAKKRLKVFEQRVADHVCPSDANALVEMKARHSSEAKALLLQIQFLKASITRESTFRSDLSHQKEYLSSLVRQKQFNIDATLSTLAQLGLPRPAAAPRRVKLSFRGAACAVIAIARMSSLKTQWQSDTRVKMRLRNQAYPATRGKPFINLA